MARTQMSEEVFRNFSGGINWRDHPSELGENEVPYAKNVTVDERGAAQKRLGYADRYGAAVGTGAATNVFDWSSQGKVAKQVGTGIHIDGGSAIHNFSTSARVTFTEYNSLLTMAHPVDGIKFWNGTTITAPTGSPPGAVSCVSAWQNRLWAAEVGTPRVWYSDIGSVNFQTTGWVDLKEKDSAAITAMAGAAGQDVSGRPGLLVFKADSSYRIYDSNTGAYSTVDPSIGCMSNIGAVNCFGRTYVVSTKGIYFTDGLEAMKEQTQLVEPFFHKDRINQNRADLYCGGRYQDRLYFSFPKAGETVNSQVLEIHPQQNWIMYHTNAASCYASRRNVTDMVFGHPSSNRFYNHGSGGSDAGTDIASSLQTSWIEPRGGNLARARRIRFVGYGQFNAVLYKNWGRGSVGDTFPVSITSPDTLTWNAGEDWDEGHLWGPSTFQGTQDFWSQGTFRSLAVRIDESSSLIGAGRDITPGTAMVETGAWSLSHVNVLVFGLGNY